ncbi:MAG TPA: DNA mismatch repair endonuclease MutL [Candidatus Limnocylindrales bacterium]|nr:DNA mismatch repair endonuclease MutL [Candidatus Limnocylindrales bacterium]
MAERAPIALLDEATIAGIAAGEVVERPSAAVKELVENALDAGATHVRVEYDDRGPIRIAVVDDGSGIADHEIELALTRHATSKIRSLGDLDSATTFGFRGEALAAIASASDLDFVTAVEGAPGGTRVIVRGGRIVERAPAASRRGTRIHVEDLFASVPARRKFLKSAATEAAYVSDVVRRFALARPDVHFVLESSGRIALDVAPVASAQERVRQVFGREVAESLVEVDAHFAGLRLTGFISRPGAAWGTARRMAIFVGGRAVRERLLFQAVLEGYQTYLLKGRYPAVSLFFDCDPGEVDVNVHPSKLEVRFSRPDDARRFVTEAVRDALRQSASPLGRWGLDATESLRRRVVSHTPPAQSSMPRRKAAPYEPATEAQARRQDAAPIAADSHIPGYEPAAAQTREEPREQLAIDLGREREADALGRFHVIGQIFDGYFVCEGDGEVLLVDQHAAHERILFERLMEAFSGREVARQALLLPERVHVGAAGVEACAGGRDALESLGWEIEPFGDEDVVVRAVPAMAGSADPHSLVEAVASDLVEAGRARAAERLAERIMATVACHAAVRVGKRLDPAAARALLAEMATVSYHSTCPHGRPVARPLSRGQVERMFGR